MASTQNESIRDQINLTRAIPVSSSSGELIFTPLRVRRISITYLPPHPSRRYDLNQPFGQIIGHNKQSGIKTVIITISGVLKGYFRGIWSLRRVLN